LPPTAAALDCRYEKADYSDAPQISYTEGDSTVPLAGLVAAPERWQQLPDQPPVLLTEWGSVGHAGGGGWPNLPVGFAAVLPAA